MNVQRVEATVGKNIFMQIAGIHAAELKAGLLPLFGEEFLARFYRVSVADSDTLLFAAFNESDTVEGFIFGSASPGILYAKVLVQLAPFVLWRLIQEPSLMFRALSLSRYVGRSGSRGGAELLSIAVRADCQRREVGSDLLRAFQHALLIWDIRGFSVAASETQKSALRFYRKHGGRIISEVNLGGLRTFVFTIGD